ncbi:MAG: hypothetical protein IPG34_16565 [Rhodocyclaceae bacterium]|nr:hypothetical protein [Rhodocyclaceae bacterium]
MNEDLQLVNERILAVPLGSTPSIVERYVPILSVCLGQLKLSAKQISEFVPSAHENTLDVVASNRTYLEFARVTARDILAGNFEGLLILSIDLDQARALAKLSISQIKTMAYRHDGLIFEPRALPRLPHRCMHRPSRCTRAPYSLPNRQEHQPC